MSVEPKRRPTPHAQRRSSAEAADGHAADPADEPGVLRHPVQLRDAADRREPDLRVPRRQPRTICPSSTSPGRSPACSSSRSSGRSRTGPGARAGAAASRSSSSGPSAAASACSCSRSSRRSGWRCCCCGSSTPATTPRWSPTARSSPTSCRPRSSARASSPRASSPASASRSPTSRCSSSRSSSRAARRPASPTGCVGSFMLGAVCSIGTVLVSVLTHAGDPAEPRKLAALRAKKGGLGAASRRSGRPSSRCRPSCASSRWSTCSSGTAWSATGSS